MTIEAIIISDLHLGSDVCQTHGITSFLEKINNGTILTNELVLNGDVFNSLDFRRLKKKHWNILELLRKISKHKKIVWICGNHDGPNTLVSHLLGIETKEEYIIESGDKKILVLHGDRFDRFITKHPLLTSIADFFYRLIQKIDYTFIVAHKIKNASKTFLRCVELIRSRAIDYALDKNCCTVCCGHTHRVDDVTEKNIRYLNSGCWTEYPCHYITVDDGDIDVEEYKWK